MLIDSHAHLAGEKFAGDREAMLERTWSSGVSHVVVIGETTTAARDLSRSDPGRLSFTAGVHPHEAHTFDAERDLALLRGLVADGAVAIGECGLDYFYDHSPRELQLRAFQLQLDLAHDTALPVVVHTRQAEDDTTQLMRAAAARTFCTAGSSRPMRIAMMAMTTSNSMSVNAARWRFMVLTRCDVPGVSNAIGVPNGKG